MMTETRIRERLEKIRRCAGDDEMAHSKEDELVWEFVGSLADKEAMDVYDGYDLDKIQKMAKLVLQSQTIEFCRWCA